MTRLTSREALQLAADFALKADYMRADDAADFQTKVDLYETASRVALLRAHAIGKAEDVHPVVGNRLFRAAFPVI
jgi:hypothetical protein